MKNKNVYSNILKEDINGLIASCGFKEKLRNSRILITGVNGLIATYLTMFLLELNREENRGIKVYALSRSLDKTKVIFERYLDDDNFVILNQDVCSPITLDETIDYIFHAAGLASAFAIKNDPVGIIRANTIGTMNVLECAVKTKAKKVIFTSTREIYGEIEGISRVTESDMGVMDPLNIRNCYPESKRMAETLLESYYRQYGVYYNVLRIAHVYGPTMKLVDDGRVMADFIEAVVNKHDIVMNSDGSAIRSFCYITDMIKGILDVMFKGAPCKAYNIANETEPKPVRDVARMLIDLFPERNCSLKMRIDGENVRQGYLGYKITQLDTSKAETLGWKPEIKLRDGMKRTVEHFIEIE